MLAVMEFIEKAEWMAQSIKDACLVGDGLHGKVKRLNHGILYISSKNLKDGGLDLSKIDYISEDDFQKHFKKDSKALTKPIENDVILGIIGSIGQPYLVKQTDCFGLSSSVAILRPNTKIILSKYLYYWVKSPLFQQGLYSFKGGVAQGYLSLEMIKALPLHYPSLTVQQKITSILSSYDDLIENNLRRIKLLEDMAQALYREWFVHFRYPGLEVIPLVDSPLGPIPEEWEVKKLSEICNILMGQSPKSEYYNEIGAGLPFHQGVTNFGNRFPSDKTYCNLEKARTALENDILLSVRAPVGRINIANRTLIIGRGLSAIRHKQNFQSFTLYFLKEFFRQEDCIGNGAIFKAITKDDLASVMVICPNNEVIQEFEKNICHKDLFIKNLTVKTENLRQTRDLLLPRLISGQLDVDKIDLNEECLT